LSILRWEECGEFGGSKDLSEHVEVKGEIEMGHTSRFEPHRADQQSIYGAHESELEAQGRKHKENNTIQCFNDFTMHHEACFIDQSRSVVEIKNGKD
jgi:hypothetical protein